MFLNAPSTMLVYLRRLTMSEEKASGIAYECVRCHAKVTSEELEMRGGRVKCTSCGYRVLKKIRPPVVKRVPTG